MAASSWDGLSNIKKALLAIHLNKSTAFSQHSNGCGLGVRCYYSNQLVTTHLQYDLDTPDYCSA